MKKKLGWRLLVFLFCAVLVPLQTFALMPKAVFLNAEQLETVKKIKAYNLEAGLHLEHFYQEILTSFEALRAQNADLKTMYENGEINQTVYTKTLKLRINNFKSALPSIFENFKEDFWAIMHGEKIIFYAYDSAFGEYQAIRINEKGQVTYEVTDFYGDLGPVELDFNLAEADLLQLYDLINQTPSVVYENPVDKDEPIKLIEGMHFIEVYRNGKRLRHQDDLSKLQDVMNYVLAIVAKNQAE